MKKYSFIIVLILFCTLSYPHEDKFVEKYYGNVKVETFTDNYVEEMNKTLVIAQYAEILAKKYSYSNMIFLYFSEDQLNKASINAWLPREGDNSDNIDGINIMFKMSEFDIKGCLNIIEASLRNKNKLEKLKNKFSIVYLKTPSEIVENVLKTKIYRPNVVKELERPEPFSYYYQNNYCYIIEKKGEVEKELLIIDRIVDFCVLKNDLAIIFTKTDEIKVIDSKSEIKTIKIEEVDKFYRPYKVNMLGNNKISFEFSNRSGKGNRVMMYFIDKGIFIQDIDKLVSNN